MTAAIIIGAILAVCGIFALGVYHGQHHGRQEREDLADTLDATMRNFEDYVEDHANTYPPTIWSDAVPPGGQVCAVPVSDKPGEICGMSVESEPCPEHTCACFRTADAAYEADRSRPAVDEHLADRAMDIPASAWLVPIRPCGRCGQTLPADHQCTGRAAI
jgi:hypothetical protein